MKLRKVPHIKIDALPIVDDHFSGVGHYTLDIIKEIDVIAGEGKVTYSLIVPFKWRKRVIKHNLRHYKRVIPNPIPYGAIRLLFKLRLKFPMDLIFGVGNYYFPSFLAWPTWFSRSVVVVHDTTYVSVPEYVEEKNRLFLEKAMPFSIRNAARIATVSEFSARELKRVYPFVKDTTVVYPAVSSIFSKPHSKKEIEFVREKIVIDTDDYLLSVGNIEPRKNYTRLIDAFMQLPDTYKKTLSLVIVGAGGWKNSAIKNKILEARAQGYSIILPETYVTDEELAILYSGARFFAFTPLYEGFGMSPLEAYAAGIPVVASEVTSVPEAAGSAARYVDPTSTKSIRQGIEDMLKITPEDRRISKQKADEHLRRFSWRRSAEKTLALATGAPEEFFGSNKGK